MWVLKSTGNYTYYKSYFRRDQLNVCYSQIHSVFIDRHWYLVLLSKSFLCLYSFMKKYFCPRDLNMKGHRRSTKYWPIFTYGVTETVDPPWSNALRTLILYTIYNVQCVYNWVCEFKFTCNAKCTLHFILIDSSPVLQTKLITHFNFLQVISLMPL